jgi:Tol biopolymer transport system component
MSAKTSIVASYLLACLLLCASFSAPATRARGAAQPGFLILATSTPASFSTKGQSALWRSTPDGRLALLVAHAGPGTLTDPAVAPDGRHIAYLVGGRSLWQMNADGTQARQLFAAPSASLGTLINPRYAPDGSAIAVTMGCCDSYTVYEVGVDGKHTSRLLGDTGAHILLDWSREGTQALYASDGTLWTAGLTGLNARPLGGDAPGAGAFIDAHYSPDGSHIVATLVPAVSEEAAPHAIVLMHADGRYLTLLTRDLPYDVGAPSWSPDGKSIAFSVGSGAEGPTGRQHDLWIMRYDGSHKQNITRGKIGSVVEVAWSR